MSLRFTRQVDHAEREMESLTSMVDVVFILLAFFVLTSQFGGTERDAVVGHEALRVVGEGREADLPDQVTVRLRVDAVTGGTRIIVEQVELEGDAFEGVTALLTEVNVPALPVVILPEGGVSVQAVAAALDAVLASPMRRVVLASSSAEGAAP